MLSIYIRHIDTPYTLLPLHFRAVCQLPWHYNFYHWTLLPYTCYYHYHCDYHWTLLPYTFYDYHYDDHYDYNIRVILWL